MDLITNRQFTDLDVGLSAQLTRTLSLDDIELFAIMSGDVNPAHVDAQYAAGDRFHQIVAHGMWGGALISTVLGTQLPGPGTILVRQTLEFLAPIAVGDVVTVTVEVKDKEMVRQHVHLQCTIVNQRGETVVSGRVEVIAPSNKIERERIVLPQVELRHPGRRYRRLIAMTHGLAPLRTAVIHPVDANALGGAIEAARLGLIEAVLIGPERKIRAAAELAGHDLRGYTIIDLSLIHI